MWLFRLAGSAGVSPTTTMRIQRPNQALNILCPLSAAVAATEQEGGGVWLPIMPAGQWAASHLSQGIYEITAADLAALVANFDRRIKPIEIAVREGHWGADQALGWIEQLRSDERYLYARIVWTPPGQQAIDQRLFRYVSPGWFDLQTPYTISSNGEQIPWVLDHLALTNDPFFTELPAAAERRDDGAVIYAARIPQGAEPMDLRARLLALAAARGVTLTADQMTSIITAAQALPDDAAREAHLASAVNALPLTAANPPAPAAESAGVPPASDAALTAENQRLRTEIADRDRETQRSSLESRFAAVRRGREQLAPAHARELAASAMSLPEADREAFVTRQIAALTSGFVPIGERGGVAAVHTAVGEGISEALRLAAQRFQIPTEFVLIGSVEASGGRLSLADARSAVQGMRPLTAGVEIPSLSYQDTCTLIRGRYRASYEATPSLTDRWSNRVVDNARTIDYRGLGAAPRMREMKGERQPRNFNTDPSYPVTVRDWEASVVIPISDLKADRLGQYMMRVAQMGAFAKMHPDILLASTLVAARTTLCYDGQYLCDNDHSEGSSGTQDNLLDSDGDDTLDHISSTLVKGVAAFNRFLDDRGEYLRIGTQSDVVWDIACRPEAKHLFDDLANLDVISGTTNGWKGRLRATSFPEMSTANEFLMAYLGAEAKPFITQFQTDGEPSDLEVIADPSSEYVRLNLQAFFGTHGFYNVVPGAWQYIIQFA